MQPANNSLIVMVVINYNSLSSDIQSARTMTSFVNGLKTSLIDI